MVEKVNRFCLCDIMYVHKCALDPKILNLIPKVININ